MKTYILKSDREGLEKEQTVWYLEELTAKEVFEWLKGISEKEEWLSYVKKVKNYHFGPKFPPLQPKGWIDFDDRQTISKCLNDLRREDVLEILQEARGMSGVDLVFRKKIEFAIFYYKWKASDFKRQRDYDCITCRANNWIEQQKRVCFLEKEEHEIPFPQFITETPDGKERPVVRIDNENPNWLLASVQDVYEWMIDMILIQPAMPAFEALQLYLKRICPESLVDGSATHYFRLESAISAYGVAALELPYRYFEVFEVIRGSSSMYENIENLKRENELKSKGK